MNNYIESNYEMTDTVNGALAQTTTQLWSNSYVIWNDEPALYNGTYNDKYGHSKGFFAADPNSNTAFYMIHSTPKFPAGPGQVPSYQGISKNAHMYGQSFFCYNVDIPTLNRLADGFLHNRPDVYDSNYPNAPTYINNLINGKYDDTKICGSYNLNSAVTQFYKSKDFGADLYNDCIGLHYNSSLEVESWVHGNDPVGPECGTNNDNLSTLDVQQVQFTNDNWSIWDDHSKWAVGQSPLVCFGDINRMQSQYVRGGGAMCFQNSALWNAMNSIVASTDSC